MTDEPQEARAGDGITPEQLERVRSRLDQMAEGWCPCRNADTDWPTLEADLRAFLAAYEQAEARAEKYRVERDKIQRGFNKANSRADTAQASEARLREAARVRDEMLTQVAIGAFDPKYLGHWLSQLDPIAALASTPDPEARCDTCGTDNPEWCRHEGASHGHDKTYGPPIAGGKYEDGHRCCPDPFHDPAPDPTPSPDRQARGAREWTLEVCPKCGATEEMEPQGCDYCEVSGGHLERVLVREAAPPSPDREPGEGNG